MALSLRPIAFALLVLTQAGWAQSPDPHKLVQVIRQVEWSAIDPAQGPAAVPAPDAEWTRFELPLRWPVKEGEPMRTIALRMHFSLSEAPSDPWGLLISELSDGGRIQLNGHFESLIPGPDASTHVRWWRPHLAVIDPSDLNAGDNVLLIQMPFRAGQHVLSGIEVGPLKPVASRFDWAFFLNRTCTWIGATVAAMVALIFGALWWRRRDALIGLLALSSVAWVGYSVYFLVDMAPLSMRLALECLRETCSGGFVALISISLLRMSGIQSRRWEWLILAYAALGPVALAGSALSAAPYLDQAWLPGLIVIGATITALGLYRGMQSLAAPPPIVLVTALATVAAALVDLGLVFGPSTLGVRTR